MLELDFRIEGARLSELSASPEIALTVRVSALPSSVRVQSLLLRAAVRLDGSIRTHSPAERERLAELFGGRGVWERSTRDLVWTRLTTVVPAFSGSAAFEVGIPCSFDLAVAAFRYLHALEGGSVPIRLEWSGTAFLENSAGVSAAPIPWDRESHYTIPTATFRAAIDARFPGAAVLTVSKDVFDALEAYRRREGLLSEGDAVERLLSLVRAGAAE